MKTKTILLILVLTAAVTGTRAQQTNEPKTNPNGFYIGVQGGVPLMWGDLFSLGEKMHLGYTGGVYAGYTIGKWFSPELSFDYGVAKLGPKNHQLNDYFNSKGIITYVQHNAADRKLGDIYSKTTYMQGGLRLQASLLNLFRPDVYHPFDIELAPAVYAQKFSPKLYDAADNKELAMGADAGGWNYGVGGDLGLRFRFSPQVSMHLRQSLIWLRNEAFEGVNNDPLWRVNLMANTTLGITLHLGKPRPAPAKPVEVVVVQPEPEPETPPVVDDSAEKAAEAERLRQEQLAAEQAVQRETYLREVAALQPPALFFRRGYHDIDLRKYQTNLDEMVQMLNKYADTDIHVEGWCDVTGGEAINAKLSRLRAETLRDYLVGKGIDANRFKSVQGMGVDHEGGYDQIARRAQIKLQAK